MFQNKADILLLLYIGILIFAGKIFDNHHAYNRRSEITKVWCMITKILSNPTCLISAVKLLWLSYHLIFQHRISFTCRILDIWRSIELTITIISTLRIYRLGSSYLNLKSAWFIYKSGRVRGPRSFTGLRRRGGGPK